MDSTTGFGSRWRIRNEEVKKTEIKPASVVKTEPVEPNKDFDFFFLFSTVHVERFVVLKFIDIFHKSYEMFNWNFLPLALNLNPDPN